MRPLRGLLWAALLAWTALVLTAQQPGTQATPLRVYLFDVGQGDGALIQSPSGQNVVVDAGGSSTRMSEHLAELGVTRIDLVIASHNHADHIGGIPALIDTFRPPLYLDNAIPASTLVQQRVFDSLERAGTRILEPTARQISLGDVTLRVVPPPGVPSWDQNDNSIGLLLEYGTFRMSFAGDAEQREWAWWNVHHPGWLAPVHVHKASHHGSANGDSQTNLALLTPSTVVISAGADNSYGHPDPGTLAAYSSVGATVYRTDTNGTVLIEVSSSSVRSVHVERGTGTPSTTPASPTSPSPEPAATPLSPTFTLSGSTLDATSGAAVAGVAVLVADGPNAGRVTTTDSSGTYSLSGLEQSGFTVTFSRSGYQTTSRGVTLVANVTLSPALPPTSTSTVATTPAPAPAPAPSPSPSPAPTPAPSPSAPTSSAVRVGATCRDMTSSSATGRGACSSHGGVYCWRYSDGTCRSD